MVGLKLSVKTEKLCSVVEPTSTSGWYEEKLGFMFKVHII